MAITFKELCDKLKMLDEVLVIEVLDIHSDEIVDRFEDRVEERRDYIEEDLDHESFE